MVLAELVRLFEGSTKSTIVYVIVLSLDEKMDLPG